MHSSPEPVSPAAPVVSCSFDVCSYVLHGTMCFAVVPFPTIGSRLRLVVQCYHLACGECNQSISINWTYFLFHWHLACMFSLLFITNDLRPPDSIDLVRQLLSKIYVLFMSLWSSRSLLRKQYSLNVRIEKQDIDYFQ